MIKMLCGHWINFSVIIQFMSLRPSEVLSVLPPNLIHLGGDGMFCVIMEFHVVRLKRMYKEEGGFVDIITGCWNWNFRLMKTCVQVKPWLLSLLVVAHLPLSVVLTVDLLRFLSDRTEEWFEWRFLSAKDSYNGKRLPETIYFLDKVSYSEEQLHDLLKRYPVLVFEGSGKKVYALFGRLLKWGFEVKWVSFIVYTTPTNLVS